MPNPKLDYKLRSAVYAAAGAEFSMIANPRTWSPGQVEAWRDKIKNRIAEQISTKLTS